MAQIRRDPTNEQIRHIIQGGDGTRMPTLDTETKEKAGLDAFVEHDDALQYPRPGDGNFGSQSAQDVQAANLQEAAGLSSMGVLGQEVDMGTMNENENQSIAGSDYGPGQRGK